MYARLKQIVSEVTFSDVDIIHRLDVRIQLIFLANLICRISLPSLSLSSEK